MKTTLKNFNPLEKNLHIKQNKTKQNKTQPDGKVYTISLNIVPLKKKKKHFLDPRHSVGCVTEIWMQTERMPITEEQ